MRNRKFTFILCMALAAAVALFGVTEAKAQTILGWDVELVIQPNELGEGRTYVYELEPTQTVDKLSFVEILLRHELEHDNVVTSLRVGNDNVDDVSGYEEIPNEVLIAPSGDTGTAFGVGLLDHVLKIKSNSSKPFPLDKLHIKIELDTRTPPPNYVLGAPLYYMLGKAGNGNNTDTIEIGMPGFVPFQFPPPIGIDTEYISVEGHTDYDIALIKDPYGELKEICLVDDLTKTVVISISPPGDEGPCCTQDGSFQCGIGTEKKVELNLGDLGESVVICRTSTPVNGIPTDVANCDYVKFATESEQKSGNSTCGYKFNGRKYAYTCW